jgi:hypothetical protein
VHAINEARTVAEGVERLLAGAITLVGADDGVALRDDGDGLLRRAAGTIAFLDPIIVSDLGGAPGVASARAVDVLSVGGLEGAAALVSVGVPWPFVLALLRPEGMRFTWIELGRLEALAAHTRVVLARLA